MKKAHEKLVECGLVEIDSYLTKLYEDINSRDGSENRILSINETINQMKERIFAEYDLAKKAREVYRIDKTYDHLLNAVLSLYNIYMKNRTEQTELLENKMKINIGENVSHLSNCVTAVVLMSGFGGFFFTPGYDRIINASYGKLKNQKQK